MRCLFGHSWLAVGGWVGGPTTYECVRCHKRKEAFMDSSKTSRIQWYFSGAVAVLLLTGATLYAFTPKAEPREPDFVEQCVASDSLSDECQTARIRAQVQNRPTKSDREHIEEGAARIEAFCNSNPDAC